MTDTCLDMFSSNKHGCGKCICQVSDVQCLDPYDNYITKTFLEDLPEEKREKGEDIILNVCTTKEQRSLQNQVISASHNLIVFQVNKEFQEMKERLQMMDDRLSKFEKQQDDIRVVVNGKEVLVKRELEDMHVKIRESLEKKLTIVQEEFKWNESKTERRLKGLLEGMKQVIASREVEITEEYEEKQLRCREDWDRRLKDMQEENRRSEVKMERKIKEAQEEVKKLSTKRETDMKDELEGKIRKVAEDWERTFKDVQDEEKRLEFRMDRKLKDIQTEMEMMMVSNVVDVKEDCETARMKVKEEFERKIKDVQEDAIRNDVKMDRRLRILQEEMKKLMVTESMDIKDEFDEKLGKMQEEVGGKLRELKIVMDGEILRKGKEVQDDLELKQTIMKERVEGKLQCLQEEIQAVVDERKEYKLQENHYKRESEKRHNETKQDLDKRVKDTDDKYYKIKNETQTRFRIMETDMHHLENKIQEDHAAAKDLLSKTNKEIQVLQDNLVDDISGLRGRKHGIYLWKFDDYRRKKEDAKLKRTDCWLSEPFYSGEFGYKMRLRLHFSDKHGGSGDPCVCVYFQFLKGDFDQILPPIFYHRGSISLMDQSDRDIKKPITWTWEPNFHSDSMEKWMRGNRGLLKMLPQSLIERGDTYLRSDTIFFKVVVEPVSAIWRNYFSDDGLLTFKIGNYFERKQDEREGVAEYVTSDTFYSAAKGYRMRARVYLNGEGEGKGSHLSVLLEFLRGRWDSDLSAVYHHKTTFLLMDQSGAATNKRHVTYVTEPHFGSDLAENWMKGPRGPLKFAPHSLVEEGPYVRNDTIVLQIHVMPICCLMKDYMTEDGALVWRIPNYSQRKADERDGVIECSYSDCFYSGRCGYRMKAKLFLNGYGKGKGNYLSIYLGFLKGSSDEVLPSIFPHKRKFMIVDQRNSGNAVVKTDRLNPEEVGDTKAREIMGNFWGFHQFVSMSEVEIEPYLVDDEMVIKIVVEPL